MLLPQILRLIVDQCFGQKRFDLLPYYALLYVGSDAVKTFFVFGREYMTQYVAQKTVYDIRNKLFDHIQRLSFSYYDEAETGQLVSRSTADADAVQLFLGSAIMHSVSQFFAVIGVTTICITMNWKLTIAMLSMLPVLSLSLGIYSYKIGPLLAAAQDQLGKLTGVIQQNLMGVRVVKTFTRENFEIKNFDRESYSLLERQLDSARVSAFYNPMVDFIAAAGLLLVLYYGGMLVIKNQLSLGELVAFLAYVQWFTWPVKVSSWIAGVTQNAVVSAQRIFQILDTHSETHLKDGSIPLKDCKGHIIFDDVSFCYKDGSRTLSNIRLDVKPGEMVALMGGTGSGKSSLINLLPRFYDATEGIIYIDNTDIRQYKLESLRRNIGIVSQEPFLFGGTIYENIAYGRVSAPIDEVIKAASAANIHDFIESLPEGYDTRIGERGVNLSGGQKQRVAIARAILLDPPVLILDDATSNVDTETEALIQKALISLTKSRTTFVVAQRVSTVKRADKIAVLDKGRLVECGTHDELMASDGRYAELFKLQFGSHVTEE